MIVFLQFFREYWIVIVFAAVFFAGYHVRGLQDAAKEESAIIAQANKDNKIDENYADLDAQINKLYENLNERMTYAYAYSCIIPIDGLRLLTQATR